MDNKLTARTLSHDERHAAEAAFAGRPFNPHWSDRARVVYEGILKSWPTPAEDSSVPTPVASEAPQPEESDSDSERAVPSPVSFQQALDAGSLIDVTPTAKQLGLSFSVTLTKTLWETGIAPGDTLTAAEQAARLRDVLMAFRLRLASQPTIAPLIDFPALLAFPHGAVPQPVPLFALVQPEEQKKAMVTLLLPTEVATTMIPLN